MRKKLYFFYECFKLANTSILTQKLRSFLTILGIVIGVTAVVSVSMLGKTLKSTVYDSFTATLGSNLIWADVILEGMEQGTGDAGKISNQMIAAYEEKYAGIVNPIIELGQDIQGIVYYDNQDNYGSTYITGISPVYQQSYSISMVEGRFITERDCQENRGTIVISEETAQLCFGEEDAIGKEINCKDEKGIIYPFVVVGIYKFVDFDGSYLSSTNHRNYKLQSFTSYTYASKLLGTEINRALGHIEWQVELNENESIEDFAKETENFFNRYFEDSDYYVMVSTTKESIESINQIIKVLTMVVSVVYIISLIVGGVGVMNIMLINVSHRTKEIGIRKSLGATNQMIQIQFLTEAVVLCLIGCIIGIVGGIILGGVSTMMLPSILGDMLEKNDTGSVQLEVGIKIDYYVVGVSFLFSILLGILFGYYPAKKAAKKNPIEALRS